MDVAPYVDILSRNLKSSARKMNLNCSYSENNVPKHTSRLDSAYFEDNIYFFFESGLPVPRFKLDCECFVPYQSKSG